MQIEDWEKLDRERYSLISNFDGTDYKISVFVQENSKSIKIWVGVSSGNKRKHLEIYEDSEVVRVGGIKALLWIKNEILRFGTLYGEEYKGNLKVYMCIEWADSRRRDIYHRSLSKEGFRFGMDEGEKILIKRLK